MRRRTTSTTCSFGRRLRRSRDKSIPYANLMHHSLTRRRAQEDELYDMQFGEAFAAQALDPNDKRNVLRDDYALEIAGAASSPCMHSPFVLRIAIFVVTC